MPPRDGLYVLPGRVLTCSSSSTLTLPPTRSAVSATSPTRSAITTASSWIPPTTSCSPLSEARCLASTERDWIRPVSVWSSEASWKLSADRCASIAARVVSDEMSSEEGRGAAEVGDGSVATDMTGESVGCEVGESELERVDKPAPESGEPTRRAESQRVKPTEETGEAQAVDDGGRRPS